MADLKLKFKMPDDETLAKYIPIKGEKGENGDSGTWGEIGGTLTNQTDLMTVLNGKANSSDTPTKISDLEDDSDFIEHSELEVSYVSGEGSTVTLEDTQGASLASIILKGNSSQSGTPKPANPVLIKSATGENTISVADTDYPISLGDIKLAGIGDHRDYIYKVNNEWYLHEEIAKIVLEGSTNQFSRKTGQAGNTYAFELTNFVKTTTDSQVPAIMSDCFAAISWGDRQNYTDNAVVFVYKEEITGDFRFGASSDITTLTKANNWLVSNPVNVYYALETPTETLITDETLLDQLETLCNATGSVGTTVITSTYESGNSQLVLSASMAKESILPVASKASRGAVAIGVGLQITDGGVLSVLSDNMALGLAKKKPFYFNNIQDMQAYALETGDCAMTLGYYEADDGGSALYRVTDSLLPDNGGEIITLANGLKAELIAVNGTVNVKQFGAKGDGATNDTTAIQNAINYAGANELTLELNNGDYLVSQVVISQRVKLIGGGYDSVIKSIDNNTNDSIIFVLDEGLYKSEISNFRIDGNKANNTAGIDALKLYVDADGTSGDKYTLIHDITIRNASGNGILVDGAKSSSDIREIRLSNIDVGGCNLSGIYLGSCSDSFLSFMTMHSNEQYGFNLHGGNHKVSNCKAFWNGIGDGVSFEDPTRIPVSAFSETTDTTYNPSKTYYIRSGSGVNNDWYIFNIFHGSSFDGGTTYYELSADYYKRYAGFFCGTSRSLYINCEAQDNYGDGFYLTSSDNSLTSIMADNNGLITASGTPVSYASQNKTQLYYGVYTKCWRTTITGHFANFRYSSIGVSQKAPIMIDSVSQVKGSIFSENQDNKVYTQSANLNRINVLCNNINYRYEYDVSKIPLDSGLEYYGSATDNHCWLYKMNNVVYFRFTITDENGILPTTSERSLFTLPANFRPSTIIFRKAYLTDNHGYNLVADCNLVIYATGSVRARVNSTDFSAVKGIIIEGSFPVDS